MADKEGDSAPVLKIGRLAALGTDEAVFLAKLCERTWPVRAGSVVVKDTICGSEGAKLLVQGWAYRSRSLGKGKRQIMSFYLPGDFIGSFAGQLPLLPGSVHALTELHLADAQPLGAYMAGKDAPGLRQAVCRAETFHYSYMINHLARLGTLSAADRIIDFLQELKGRIELAGLASDTFFEMPIRQEMLAEYLGLSLVHLSRTLRQLRRERRISTRARFMALAELEPLQQ
jgi:CRP-like cAMP-binding protein